MRRADDSSDLLVVDRIERELRREVGRLRGPAGGAGAAGTRLSDEHTLVKRYGVSN